MQGENSESNENVYFQQFARSKNLAYEPMQTQEERWENRNSSKTNDLESLCALILLPMPFRIRDAISGLK